MLFVPFVHRVRVGACVAVLLGTLPALTYASNPPLTLEAAVQKGVADAPGLMAHHAHVASMQEEAVRAGRLPDPVLNFGVENFPVTAPGAFSVRSDPMTMRTVGITQGLPSRAARTAEKAVANAEVDAAGAEEMEVTRSIQERVADAWITLWATQQKRVLLLDLRVETELAVRTAQARLRGGDGTATDALAARAEAASLDNRLEQVDADRSVAQAGLQRWLGDAITNVAEAPPDFSMLPVDPQRLEQAVDQQAPMQVWQAREQVAQADLERARAAKHPDWNLSFIYGKRAQDLSDMVMLQVGVSLPLFTRNRQDRGISAKEDQWEAVQDAHEDARRQQREAVASTIANWESLGRQIQRYRDTLLPLGRDRTQTALAAYRGGGPLQPWLDARRDEIELRLRYADTLMQRAQLWASLAYLLPSSEPRP